MRAAEAARVTTGPGSLSNAFTVATNLIPQQVATQRHRFATTVYIPEISLGLS
jgi:hypothetical protein